MIPWTGRKKQALFSQEEYVRKDVEEVGDHDKYNE